MRGGAESGEPHGTVAVGTEPQYPGCVHRDTGARASAQCCPGARQPRAELEENILFLRARVCMSSCCYRGHPAPRRRCFPAEPASVEDAPDGRHLSIALLKDPSFGNPVGSGADVWLAGHVRG